MVRGTRISAVFGPDLERERGGFSDVALRRVLRYGAPSVVLENQTVLQAWSSGRLLISRQACMCRTMCEHGEDYGDGDEP